MSEGAETSDGGLAPGIGEAAFARDDGELLSRLRVIEDQALETRAEAYAQLLDELRQRLEGERSPGSDER